MELKEVAREPDFVRIDVTGLNPLHGVESASRRFDKRDMVGGLNPLHGVERAVSLPAHSDSTLLAESITWS
jgi:hypothetical protein